MNKLTDLEGKPQTTKLLIEPALERQSKAIEELCDQIGLFQERLGGILSPEIKSPIGTEVNPVGEPESIKSRLVEHVLSNTRRIEEFGCLLHRIYDHLEI